MDCAYPVPYITNLKLSGFNQYKNDCERLLLDPILSIERRIILLTEFRLKIVFRRQAQHLTPNS